MLLLFSLSLLHATDDLGETIEQGAGLPFDWRFLVAAALFLTIILSAIAFMIGHAFEMHDLEAWGKVELTQTISTAIIIVVAIGAISFFDGLFRMLITEVGIDCSTISSASCANEVAQQYVSGIKLSAIESYNGISNSVLFNSYWASRRVSFSCHPLILPFPCLQSTISIAPLAYLQLSTERDLILLDDYINIFSSLDAQLFFLKDISFKIGPLILILGIIGRSFFLTRSLGGLLIAIAFGIMFVFPMMYIFDGVTLAVTLYGAGANGPISEQLTCPAVCLKSPPILYNKDTLEQYFGSISQKEEKIYFEGSPEEEEKTYNAILKECKTSNDMMCPDDLSMPFEEYKLLSTGQYTFFLTFLSGDLYGSFGPLVSCNAPVSNSVDVDEDLKNWLQESTADKCPFECRKIPYPFDVQTCKEPQAQWYCEQIPEQCKVLTVMDPTTLTEGQKEMDATCPSYCKTIPALSNNCFEAKPGSTSKGYSYSKDCDSYEGGDFIEYAKSACLGQGIPVNSLYYFNSVPIGDPDGGMDTCWVDCKYLLSCFTAPLKCRIGTYTFSDGDYVFDEDSVGYQCSGMSAESAEYCPTGLDEDGNVDPYNSCVFWIPADTIGCSGCLFTDKMFRYTPPTAVDCATACTQSDDGTTMVSAADFAKASKEGMFGSEGIKDVSSLMLPAYLLPLLNMVVTIIFIRTVSPMLGGDIEIPGLAHVL